LEKQPAEKREKRKKRSGVQATWGSQGIHLVWGSSKKRGRQGGREPGGEHFVFYGGKHEVKKTASKESASKGGGGGSYPSCLKSRKEGIWGGQV